MSRKGVLWTVAGGLALLTWVAALWNTGDASSGGSDAPRTETPAAPEARSTPQLGAAPAPEPAELEPEPEADEPGAAPPAQPQPAAAEQAPKSPFGRIPAPEAEGPLDELREKFEREPRASSAYQMEALAKRAFDNPNVDPGLFESVLCRQTVCRVRMRWSSERMVSYIAAVTILRDEFGPEHAVQPARADDADGTRALEVYVRERRPDDPPGLSQLLEKSGR